MSFELLPNNYKQCLCKLDRRDFHFRQLLVGLVDLETIMTKHFIIKNNQKMNDTYQVITLTKRNYSYDHECELGLSLFIIY